MPDAPPKETRTVAPDALSAEIRFFTVASPMPCVPFHVGVQELPSAMVKARLYVEGDAAASRSEASVALT